MKEDKNHVDHYIWKNFQGDPYAQWVLMHFRLPAIHQTRWMEFMNDHKLFCTFEGSRYRVTGASRLGDVWLTGDFSQDMGYEKRVKVLSCTEWGAEPFPVLCTCPLCNGDKVQPEPSGTESCPRCSGAGFISRGKT